MKLCDAISIFFKVPRVVCLKKIIKIKMFEVGKKIIIKARIIQDFICLYFPRHSFKCVLYCSYKQKFQGIIKSVSHSMF